MKRVLLLGTLFCSLIAVAASQPLVQPFTFVMPTYDSVRSEWLPQAPVEIAGSHGFLKVSEDGHLEFTDGTPVRFTGTGMIFRSCFPDSLSANQIPAAGK